MLELRVTAVGPYQPPGHLDAVNGAARVRNCNRVTIVGTHKPAGALAANGSRRVGIYDFESKARITLSEETTRIQTSCRYGSGRVGFRDSAPAKNGQLSDPDKAAAVSGARDGSSRVRPYNEGILHLQEPDQTTPHAVLGCSRYLTAG